MGYSGAEFDAVAACERCPGTTRNRDTAWIPSPPSITKDAPAAIAAWTSVPTQALGQVAGKAFLAHPERCTYCTVCEDVCPEDAIALPFLIVLAPQVVH